MPDNPIKGVDFGTALHISRDNYSYLLKAPMSGLKTDQLLQQELAASIDIPDRKTASRGEYVWRSINSLLQRTEKAITSNVVRAGARPPSRRNIPLRGAAMDRCMQMGRFIAIASIFATPSVAMAQADLYVADRPADNGVQPNPDTGPMWLSEDIWIRTSPDPSYRPVPFDPAAPSWTPAPHQNPEYRDPRYGIPNYVYVRVRNRGNAASSGTETLQMYWSKASTGLAWPASWVDNYGPVCGVNRLLGAEITKPRKNAAHATDAERTQLRDAFVEMASDPSFALLAGYNYWTKQQHVHRLTPEHVNPAFLPWHREYLNRMELLLQEADPRVRLMYWHWTTDPENTPSSTPGTNINLYSSGFMGNSGRGTSGTDMGPALAGLVPHPSDSSVQVVRQLSISPSPGAESDSIIVGRTDYQGTIAANNFSERIERQPNHNTQHGYLGGNGDMAFPCCSTRDPFFFLLHGKVDELWAVWQRANLARVEAATAYGTAATHPVITAAQHPWDGLLRSGGAAMDPWTPSAGFIVTKTSFDRSVLSPPVYDTAPLRIPALAPGQAVILEIPWYPPNPAHYACMGDMRHFCLLSRVQPGITTPEISDVNANVRNNNNLAWKNIQIIDDFAGAMAMMSMMVANDSDAQMKTAVLLREVTNRYVRIGDQVEAVHLGVPAEIFQRMEMGGQLRERFTRSDLSRRLQAPGMPRVPRETVFLSMRGGIAELPTIDLRPGERFPLQVLFQIKPDYVPTRDRLQFDVAQRRTDSRTGHVEIVGGVQAQLDLSALNLVKERGHWRVAHGNVPRDWVSPRFDDTKWREAPAPLGFGPEFEALSGVVAGEKTAFFRKRFDVPDPRFLRDLTLRLRADDRAVVYLNGREVHRSNGPVTGAAEKAYFPVKLPLELLREGSNVIAVEVHQGDDKDADLLFDAALLANRADTAEAPSVRIGLDEALVRVGQTRRIGIDAVDPDGRVRKVTLFVDDRLVGRAEGPGASFDWAPREGAQRLRAVVEDNQGLTATEEREVVGVRNLPPKVRMQARPGRRPGTIVLSADAVDDDGQVRRVQFFVAKNNRFDAPLVLAGTATRAPFQVTVRLPQNEHRIVTARAIDNGGEIGIASTHVAGGQHH